MKYLSVAVLGAAAVVAGCGSDSNDVISTNAVGYFGDVNMRTAQVTGSGGAAANISVNGDDTVTVVMTEGPDAGQSANFYADGSGGFVSDDADAYLQLGYFNNPAIKEGPVVALIEVEPGGDDLTFTAVRSTNGMTPASQMPLTGTAVYRGNHLGGAAVTDYSLPFPPSTLDYIEGGFQANVNFGTGQLAGAMQSDMGDITFDATIQGSEFNSNPNSIAIANDYGLINQGASGVEGGFYGPAAAGMAGTYLLNGAGDLTGSGAVGTFIADR
ncbi:transferrin-binding protein-like solute binding protein [Martelella limonii]|uniref:transferrin-binding protein-like solute binding protein n=1 Tax=Martelella limonii TaxID=1647649 RepID=UPI001580E4A8|nr:transferrin-binding protein-like solute binding protein [Martelella limonii]